MDEEQLAGGQARYTEARNSTVCPRSAGQEGQNKEERERELRDDPMDGAN